MSAIYQQRKNLELPLDRFNWAKASDHVSPSSNAELYQRKESKPPAKGGHTEVKLARGMLNAPGHLREQQHQLELVPQRKRFKQAGTGTGGPSKATTTTNNYANRNPKDGGGSIRDTGGGAGPSKPRKDAAGSGEDGGENNNDADDDDDVADEELPKRVDTQCAQCDDGGFLIECIGRCRRAFHVGIEPEEEAGGVEDFEDDEKKGGEKGNDSYEQIDCNVINIAEDLAIALAASSSQLLCPSCLAYEQRCSYCGKFDDEGTKVRPCLVASCGHFYHPACVKEAKRNMKLNNAARSLKDMCPLHWCCICGKQGETGGSTNTTTDGSQNNELVQCRRCPTAYHRGCIPSSWNGLEGEPQRAWMADFDSDGHLLPGCTVETSMLYCQVHELDDDGIALHKVPLFTENMKKAWDLHYAKEFPHLESSKRVLREKGVLGLVRESPVVIGGALGIAGGSGGRSMRDALGADGVFPSTSAVIPESIAALDASSMRATTEIDAIIDARRMLDEAKIQIDIAGVKSRMVQPYPYRNRSKSSIDRGVLANLEATMSYVDKNTSGAEDRTLTTLVCKDDIQAIDESYRFLSYYTSPYMFPANYYSFGRIFIRKELIKHVVGRLSHLLRTGDCIVDLNCGKNEFIPLVKEVARKDGILVTGQAFDVIVPKDLTDFVRKPWKAVTPESDDLPDGHRLVIGLKSPHGKEIRLSNVFIEHISTFSARIIVLVVPLESIIPRGYDVILEDRQICNVRDTFYDPSSNRSLLQAEAGDHVFRVLVRSDLKHSIFGMNGNAREKYWKEVPIPGIR